MSAYGRLQAAEERLNNLEAAADALSDAKFYVRKAGNDQRSEKLQKLFDATNEDIDTLNSRLPQLREDAEREHEAEMRYQMTEYKEGL